MTVGPSTRDRASLGLSRRLGPWTRALLGPSRRRGPWTRASLGLRGPWTIDPIRNVLREIPHGLDLEHLRDEVLDDVLAKPSVINGAHDTSLEGTFDPCQRVHLEVPVEIHPEDAVSIRRVLHATDHRGGNDSQYPTAVFALTAMTQHGVTTSEGLDHLPDSGRQASFPSYPSEPALEVDVQPIPLRGSIPRKVLR